MTDTTFAETLGQKQRRFAAMVARLIDRAIAMGFGVTLGDAYRDPRVFGAIGTRQGYGESRSAHKQRLAIDINLFIDDVYLTETDAYGALGQWWEEQGGTWGGRWNDGNHFSVEHNGIA